MGPKGLQTPPDTHREREMKLNTRAKLGSWCDRDLSM